MLLLLLCYIYIVIYTFNRFHLGLLSRVYSWAFVSVAERNVGKYTLINYPNIVETILCTFLNMKSRSSLISTVYYIYINNYIYMYMSCIYIYIIPNTIYMQYPFVSYKNGKCTQNDGERTCIRAKLKYCRPCGTFERGCTRATFWLLSTTKMRYTANILTAVRRSQCVLLNTIFVDVWTSKTMKTRILS